jgi:GntR family transcriptional regulator
MQLFVTAADELPLYRQLMRQITEAIEGGQLQAGEKLPSHRELAEELVIAPLTVKKAYDELESQGLLETQRGRGTFVPLKLPRIDRARRREQVKAAVRQLLAQSYAAGLTFEELNDLLRKLDTEFRRSLDASSRIR